MSDTQITMKVLHTMELPDGGRLVVRYEPAGYQDTGGSPEALVAALLADDDSLSDVVGGLVDAVLDAVKNEWRDLCRIANDAESYASEAEDQASEARQKCSEIEDALQDPESGSLGDHVADAAREAVHRLLAEVSKTHTAPVATATTPGDAE